MNLRTTGLKVVLKMCKQWNCGPSCQEHKPLKLLGGSSPGKLSVGSVSLTAHSGSVRCTQDWLLSETRCGVSSDVGWENICSTVFLRGRKGPLRHKNLLLNHSSLEWTFKPSSSCSKGRSTPFNGKQVLENTAS